MKIEHGITRSVLLIGPLAFKFPSVKNGHKMFLEGMLANWKEREFYRVGNDYYKGLLAKSFFCSWLGLVSIQERVTINTDVIDSEKAKWFNGVSTDLKPMNFGYNKNGHLVSLDYPS